MTSNSPEKSQRTSQAQGKVYKLYVGGLLDSVQKDEISREFKKFGELRDVWVARNPPGFAFVEFIKSADAEKAVRTLDGMNVCGSRIRVEFAHTGSGGGGGGGGNNTRKGGNNHKFSSNRGRFHNSRRSPQRDISGGGRPRTPPLPFPPRGARGPLTPPRRGLSPRPSRRSPLSGSGGSRLGAPGYPYDLPGYPPPLGLPGLSGGDAGALLPFAGYPMMPFPFPEEFLRNLARARSPYSAAAAAAAAVATGMIPPLPARAHSPSNGRRGRSRSRGRDRDLRDRDRSPFGRGSHRDRDQHYNYAPAPRNDQRNSHRHPSSRRSPRRR